MKRISLSLLGCLILLLSVTPSYAAPSPFGVYDDLSLFQAAEARTRSNAATHMSEEAKEQRRLTISRLLAKVDDKDRAGQEAIARKYGLVIYNPNLAAGAMGNSGTGNMTISKVSITYDASVQERGFRTIAQWKIDAVDEIIADAGYCPGCEMGGDDAIGMTFNKVDATKITSHYAQWYDKSGGYQGYNGTLTFSPEDGTKLNQLIQVDDWYLGDSTKVLNTWKTELWVWGEPAAFLAGGSVYPYFAHDYDTTELTGATFSASSDLTKFALNSGLTLTWTKSTQKWAIQENPTAY